MVVVAMGRGGPAEPVVAETPPTLEDLLEPLAGGGHAASDYLEVAALARVPTIGCRRAGGGFAGAVVESNVLEGARLAAERRPDLVVFEGSGARCRRSRRASGCSWRTPPSRPRSSPGT